MKTAVDETFAVELIGLTKSYRTGWSGGRLHAVQGLTLRAPRGKVLGLLGPNGSGKSTTLKMLAGLIEPTGGMAKVLGVRAGSGEARALVGYLPESPQFPAHLTAQQFLGYCAGLSLLDDKSSAAGINEVLAWSGLAGNERKLGTFSKGMSQRLGLAQAILHDPPVVLLDEPASGLDPEGRIALAELIRDLAVRGKTVVFSSHLLTQVGELCDYIAILGRGRLLAEGTTEEFLGDSRRAPTEPSWLEKIYLEKLRAHE
ncbi:ABC transporter ATP-binding protein [Oleiharenicola lentus]|uniref:ABC transporter ATP-binding protein n=1 Tax=Oleiharenicola lentus TaxID=2508720 RepID=UPI003F6690A1